MLCRRDTPAPGDTGFDGVTQRDGLPVVNLSSFLAIQSKPRLRELAGLWELGEIAAHLGRGQLAAALAQRMTDRWSVAEAMARLSPDAQQAVVAIAGHPGGRGSASLLTKELGLAEAAVAAALDELLQWGCLWPPVPAGGRLDPAAESADRHSIVQMPDEVARLVRAVEAERRESRGGVEPLRELIGRLDEASLEKLSVRWRIGVTPFQRKREVVNALLVAMLDQHALQDNVREAGPLAEQLVAVLHDAPPMSADEAAAKAGLPPDAARTGLRELAALGLAHATYLDGQRLVYLPRDVTKAHRAATAAPVALQPLAAAPAVEETASTALLLDLMTILNYVRLHTPKLTVDGRLPKRTLNTLNEHLIVKLDEADEISYARFNFIATVLARRELALARDGRWVAGDEVADWEALSFPEQARVICQWWLHETHWIDATPGLLLGWAGASHVKGRQRLVAWLEQLQPEQWYSLGAILDAIRQKDPMILRSRPEVIRYLGYHGLEKLMRDWGAVDGAALTQMLVHPLHWIGAVDVGRGPDGRPAAIRLTALGRWLIGDPTAPPPELGEGPPLVVQPNFEVLALWPDAPTLYRLGLFAELRRADRVATFELTRPAALLAVDRGSSIEDLIKLLTERSRTGLPQNVEFTLRDWTRTYRRVHLEAATLLEVDDSTVLDQIMGSSRHKAKISRRLSPTAAVLEPGTSTETFVNALRRDGFYAHLRGGAAETAAPGANGRAGGGGGRGWRRR